MNDIRLGLGTYHPESPKGFLTLHEIAELIRRAGKAAGFIVRSECKIVCRSKEKGKIDWVWYDSATHHPIVAFEIEGRDVGRKHLEFDFEKFAHFNAPLNIISLFQVDHDHSLKGNRTDPHDWVRSCFLNWSQECPADYVKLHGECPLVFLDYELMNDEGIERIQSLAKTAQTKLFLTLELKDG